MKCNKKAFVTMLVSAILALALLLTGGILLSRMPHNSVVASAIFSENRRLVAFLHKRFVMSITSITSLPPIFM